jgi:hypothetical protein
MTGRARTPVGVGERRSSGLAEAEWPASSVVTERTYERLRERYELVPRGTVEVKAKAR